MRDLKEVFNNLIQKKKEKRERGDSLRDALKNSQEYQIVSEELRTLKEKHKKLKDTIMSDFQKDTETIERLNIDIASDQIMLSDIAISSYVEGKNISIEDDNGTKYEPEFSVKYKKV